MRFLLDTDHLSFLQQENSPERAMIVVNINMRGERNVVACVANLHEQLLGAHNKVQAARSEEDFVRAYGLMGKLLNVYSEFEVLPFDASSATLYLDMKGRIRIKPMDLRIAAIALARDLTLVTRNARDFEKVSNLRLEDWTR